jgi:hypothetical protein
MPRVPTAKEIAASLKIRERVVLLCVASGGTEWQRLGIAGDAMATMAMKGLIDHDAKRPSLTEDGRAVVAVFEAQVPNLQVSRDSSMGEPQLADEGSIP